MGATQLIHLLHCDCQLDSASGAWRVRFDPDGLQQVTAAQADRSRGQDTCVVLLPSEQVLLTQLQLPHQSRFSLRKLVPYAVEDQLAMDIADCFFALGDTGDDGTVVVAVVQKQIMQAVLQAIDAASIRVDALVPDVLALRCEQGAWSVEVGATYTAIRTASQLGFKLETPQAIDMLVAMLQSENRVQPTTLYYYDSDKRLDWTRVKQQHSGVRLMPIKHSLMTAAAFDAGLPLNLFQADFRQKRRATKATRAWWRVGVMAGVLLCVAIAGSLTLHLLYQHKMVRQDDAITALFQRVFPQQTAPVEPVFQVRRRWEQLEKKFNGNAFGRQLQSIAAVLHLHKAVTLHSEQYDADGTTLTLHAHKPSALRALQKALQQHGISVRVSPVEHDKKAGVVWRFHVGRPKLNQRLQKPRST